MPMLFRLFLRGREASGLVEAAEALTRPYLFTREPFHLVSRRGAGRVPGGAGLEGDRDEEEGEVLEGAMDCGGNLLDEWFVVHVLMELTERFEVIATARDEDGEFLLIEGANRLPDWVSPEAAEGRVFLYKGLVHVVSSFQVPEGPGAERACLDFVERKSAACALESDVQREIKQRYLSRFPEPLLRENKHRATCLLPESCCRVLDAYPDLVPLAVSIFCSRTPEQVKQLERLMPFCSDTKLVRYSAVFTRFGYAQLCHEKFLPPRFLLAKLHPSLLQYLQRAMDEPTIGEAEAAEMKPSLLGMKLACGLDLLYGCLSKFCKKLHGAATTSCLSDELLLAKIDKLREDDVSSARSDAVSYEDDSEDWMTVSPKGFDGLLEKLGSGDPGGEEAQGPFLGIASKLQEFMNTESGVEGVEESNSGGDLDEVSLDFDRFLSVLNPAATFPGQGSDPNSTAGEALQDRDGDTLAEALDELVEEELQSHPNLASARGAFRKGALDPASVDMDTVSNLVESFSSQCGNPGPASTILNELNQC